MKLIVDANVLFSALIKGGETQRLLILPFFELYAPEFILEELENHQEEILIKSNRTKEQFSALLQSLRKVIEFVPQKELTSFQPKVEKFCPDPDDLPYFALALMLDCPIWSNDKELKQKQNVVKVYSTTELLILLSLQKP
ncbi:MAG: PIN domain-containing protein [Candidatus Woesearchaeota archaeon]